MTAETWAIKQQRSDGSTAYVSGTDEGPGRWLVSWTRNAPQMMRFDSIAEAYRVFAVILACDMHPNARVRVVRLRGSAGVVK